MNDKIKKKNSKKNTKQYSNYSNEQCYVGVGKILSKPFSVLLIIRMNR